ncbi:MAG: phytoene desaturase [Sphingobium sp.]|nr:phytoene desaturase [Sphingobium sp.]MCP5399509.1 phytoene desaturase [Sphingomonas sp.]
MTQTPASGSPSGSQGRKAIVIGAGFGGLALAIRLQSAGISTTVLEARDKPGGRAYYWQKDGFTFDAGPTVITDPNCLSELWRLTGHDMAQDVTLEPVSPFYRLNWSDGTNFDYSNDEASLRQEIAKLDAGDLAGYERFLDYSAAVYREGYEKLGHVAFLDFASMIKAAPALAQHQAWRSVHSMVSSYVKNEKLLQALSFHTLLVGGNPMTTSAIYALIHKLEKDGGVWFARGGTNRLVAAMVAQFERIGGTLRLGDPVEKIETIGDKATAVITKSGWRGEADAVASNADLMHSYRDLLGAHPRGIRQADKLSRKRWSPSLFVLHFGIKGTWPGIPHHMILFGPRYEGLLTDIYQHGLLSADFSLYLHHPTVTDPSMAPEGCSTFYALAPVPHMGKLPIDWEAEGPRYAERILDEIERRLIPDIRSRIVTQFHYAPPDFASDLAAHMGSAFSLEPLLTQSAWFRAHNRDDVIPNLYLVGAGTHPGAGIPGVVGSAKATARLMMEDLG